VTTIDVDCIAEADGWTCRVTVGDDRGRSDHRVRIRHGDLDRFAPHATDPDDLVRRSFEFLLARESRESILSSFDLPAIGRYFPDYEATIGPGDDQPEQPSVTIFQLVVPQATDRRIVRQGTTVSLGT